MHTAAYGAQGKTRGGAAAASTLLLHFVRDVLCSDVAAVAVVAAVSPFRHAAAENVLALEAAQRAHEEARAAAGAGKTPEALRSQVAQLQAEILTFRVRASARSSSFLVTAASLLHATVRCRCSGPLLPF